MNMISCQQHLITSYIQEYSEIVGNVWTCAIVVFMVVLISHGNCLSWKLEVNS